ncbi:tripartite tricarboxylate transporter TctB family protein [Blastococcus deserti]|uniref:Tripartite tricarboxylate transporter TctB family protein n=1 Tax=Blastococcus deserti TaxID=2259033 RepID=A0ABW4X6X7_9ACTN
MSGSPAKRGIPVEEAVVYGLLTALGLAAFVMAIDYGLFLEESRVGPGLVPAVVGGLIVLIAGWELIATLRGHRTAHDRGLAEVVAAAAVDSSPGGASSESAAPGGVPSDEPGTMSPDDGPVDIPGAGPGPDDVDIFGRTPRERTRQLWTVAAALLVAALLVPVLGLLVSFFVLSVFISAVVERRAWIPSLVVSFLAVAAVYGIFVGFLGVPLPTGLIGIGG